MSDEKGMPERVWLPPVPGPVTYERENSQRDDTEYLRADLHAAKVAELKEKLAADDKAVVDLYAALKAERERVERWKALAVESESLGGCGCCAVWSEEEAWDKAFSAALAAEGEAEKG